MNLLQLAHRNMRVDLRRPQIGMPQHRLDKTDIGAAFNRIRRENWKREIRDQVASTESKDYERSTP